MLITIDWLKEKGACAAGFSYSVLFENPAQFLNLMTLPARDI